MREIIISALLFAVLIAGIAVNSVFIRDFYEYSIEAAKKMPSAESEGCYEAVCAFDEYWHEKKTAVSFSVSYDDVERITERLRLMKAAALAKDAAEFELQREQLVTAIEHAARLERVSFESIF